MDSHLFIDIIITEGARPLGSPIVEGNLRVEYYTGRSGKRVPIMIDADDDEIDCLTGSNILVLLGMEDIIPGLFPELKQKLEGAMNN